MAIHHTHADQKAMVDWPLYMITAAVKFSSARAHESTTTYATPDAARMDILNLLNWYEAHADYAWPDFSSLGFDFSLAMRWRRALVNDVYIALKKSGTVRIAAECELPSTPLIRVACGKRSSSDGEYCASFVPRVLRGRCIDCHASWRTYDGGAETALQAHRKREY